MYILNVIIIQCIFYYSQPAKLAKLDKPQNVRTEVGDRKTGYIPIILAAGI